MRDAVARLGALLLQCNGTLLALAHDTERHRKDVDLAILIGYNLSSWTGFKGGQIAMQLRLVGRNLRCTHDVHERPKRRRKCTRSRCGACRQTQRLRWTE